MSIECTPPTLVSINSSPSPLSVKFCSTSVHRTVQNLGIYCIISWLMPVSYTRGITGRAVVGCPSIAYPQLGVYQLLSITSVCKTLFHMSATIRLEFKHNISNLVPVSYTRGIAGRAVVGCLSNAHPQLWCPSTPLHPLCLLSFVSWVPIDPFRS